jgi:hypothetical protein
MIPMYTEVIYWADKYGHVHETTLDRIIEGTTSKFKVVQNLSQNLYDSDYCAQKYASLAEIIL